MAVRIIIDRKVKKGKEADLAKLLRELRSKAIPSRGYISGETLRSMDDPHNYIVITTWQNIDDWKAWEKKVLLVSLTVSPRVPPRDTDVESGTRVTVTLGSTRLNVAVTDFAAFMVTVHVPVPEQAPGPADKDRTHIGYINI